MPFARQGETAAGQTVFTGPEPRAIRTESACEPNDKGALPHARTAWGQPLFS